jgi:hypothetical protein
MIRTIVTATLAVALAGCATYPAGPTPGYADGNYNGPYNGGYYSPAQAGNGDYYYDQSPLLVGGTPDYFGEPWPGFGWGYAGWGFGPWWGYGPGWCCHRQRHWAYAPAALGARAERDGPRHGQQSSFRGHGP